MGLIRKDCGGRWSAVRRIHEDPLARFWAGAIAVKVRIGRNDATLPQQGHPDERSGG